MTYTGQSTIKHKVSNVNVVNSKLCIRPILNLWKFLFSPPLVRFPLHLVSDE